ncbi:MAG: pyridoxal phosphate-dependent aminotransferase [Deltaproteobacteria bacterium]|nr:pyridoxal phosphate-dependent aminotransferase [Deltaproteobacteria bacterium]
MRGAHRTEEIAPFYVMQILARAAELEAAGKDVVHMEVGEPDFDTAPPIVEAGRRALAEGKTHYTPAIGIRALREAVSQFYRNRYDVEVPAERIVITPGATGALQLVLAATVDSGRSVMMTDPGYPCNRHYVTLLGGRTIAVPVDPETNYQLNADLAAKYMDADTAALLVASPANPTGAVLDDAGLQSLMALAADQNRFLIVDEIYHGLSYGRSLPTAAASPSVFVVNSFSKYFGMTGWRIGWVVAPPEHMDALDRLAQNMFLAVSTMAQHAALAAFQPETIQVLEQRRDEFQRRRDYLVPALKKLGFGVPVDPAGAFYVYADSSAVVPDSFSFCRDLLEEAGVAVTPGLDFGSHRAADHIRFAYTTSIDRLREGMDRTARFMESRRL